MTDIFDGGAQWVAESEYRFICDRVPIVCVDLLPISADGRVGLVLRKTAAGAGHCLVGGPVQRGERLADAIDRQVAATLGTAVSVDRPTVRFISVFEYFTEPGESELFDPRKHAVSLTYTGVVAGVPHPCGEALEFAWFDALDLPPAGAFSFGQHRVVLAVLGALGFGSGMAG